MSTGWVISNFKNARFLLDCCRPICMRDMHIKLGIKLLLETHNIKRTIYGGYGVGHGDVE